MPRITRPPSYRLHKARNCAVVTIDGRNHYLGRYGSLESFSRFLELFSNWMTAKFGPVQRPVHSNESAVTINQLMLAYWEFAKQYYVKNGLATDEQFGIKAALRHLRRLYGHKSVGEFGPLDLEVVRNGMIDSDLSRRVINQYVERIRRMFRWGVSKQVVPPDVYAALASLDGLRKGRSKARETKPVRPVPDADLQATLPCLSETLRTMVQFQLLTGCRPGEVCALRPIDIDRTDDEWCYHCGGHKTDEVDPQNWTT